MALPSPFGLAGQALTAAQSTLGAADRLGELVDAVLDIREELRALRTTLDPRTAQLERDVKALRREFRAANQDVVRIRKQLDEVVRLLPEPEQGSDGLLAKAADAVGVGDPKS